MAREQLRTLTPEGVTPNARRIISPDLEEAINREGLTEGGKEFTEAECHAVVQRILSRQRVFDAHVRNPYHNADHPEREVLPRLEQLLGRTKVPNIRASALRFAAAGHDLGHSGRTLRDARDGLSNEEYAALLVDPIAAEAGCSPYQRVLIQGEIIATTFGNPEIGPTTADERTLVIADLGGFAGSWHDWIEESARVLEEMEPDKRPASVEGWLKGRQDFLSYVEGRLTPEAVSLWGLAFREKQHMVTAVTGRPDHERRRIITKLVEPLLKPQTGRQR